MIPMNFNEMNIGEIRIMHEKLGFDFIINDGKITEVSKEKK